MLTTLREHAGQAARVRGAGTARASSTPCRTPAWSPTPSATTGPCTTARPSPGTCATGTCSTPCSTLLGFRGPEAKAVVWEHNSHVGNAAATEMGGARRAQRRPAVPRRSSGDDAYLDRLRHRSRHGGGGHGLGRARWRSCASARRIRRATSGCAIESAVPAFLLHLREPRRPEVREELEVPRLERAIGVIYRPETELLSHYFQAVLPGSSTSTSGSTRPGP